MGRFLKRVMVSILIVSWCLPADTSFNMLDVFPRLIMRGYVHPDTVEQVMKPLESSDKMIVELATLCDDLCAVACGNRSYDGNARHARYAAQRCVLMLLKKKAPHMIDRMSIVLPTLFSLAKHQRSYEFWKWVRHLCVCIDHAMPGSCDWMIRYIEEAVREVATSPFYEVRYAAALEVLKVYDNYKMRHPVITRAAHVDVSQLIDVALHASSADEQARARELIVMFVREKNESVIKQLYGFLHDALQPGEVYDFTRLVSPDEKVSGSLLESLLKVGGRDLITLFLGESIFVYKDCEFSPLLCILTCIKDFSRLSSCWTGTDGWRSDDGVVLWSRIYSDCVTKDANTLSQLLRLLLQRLLEHDRAGRGYGLQLPIDQSLWCFMYRVLLDLHIIWWVAEYMPADFEGSEAACALSAKIGAAHDFFARGNCIKAQQKYAELHDFFSQYGVSLKRVEKQFICGV